MDSTPSNTLAITLFAVLALWALALATYLVTRAVLGLRAAVTGDAGLYTGIAELAAWLVVGVLAAILVTDRRRYLSTRRLRLAVA